MVDDGDEEDLRGDEATAWKDALPLEDRGDIKAHDSGDDEKIRTLMQNEITLNRCSDEDGEMKVRRSDIWRPD